MTLISELKLDLAECSYQFGIDCKHHFQAEFEQLRPMIDDRLLELSDKEIRITERGRPFLRNICMPFDAYLGAHQGDQPAPRFSATL